MNAARPRRLLWRTALRPGGLTVTGTLPRGGCVVVANHSSHADTPALLAALDARHRPLVAAAADYWFRAGWRARVCRTLVGGFPVRRDGGGCADLMGAVPALRAGRAVVVFAEGTRSRTGEVGPFHSGALRLAEAAGVPVVPVGLAGTRDVLPPHGALHLSPVAVRIGTPLHRPTKDEARDAVVALAAAPAPRRRSPWHRRAAALALAPAGLLLAFGWGLAEAIVWPLVPELLVALVAVSVPKAAPRLALAAAAGSLAGGLAAYALGAAGAHPPAPLTTPRMHAVAAAQLDAEGAAALRHQPFSGVPTRSTPSAPAPRAPTPSRSPRGASPPAAAASSPWGSPSPPRRWPCAGCSPAATAPTSPGSAPRSPSPCTASSRRGPDPKEHHRRARADPRPAHPGALRRRPLTGRNLMYTHDEVRPVPAGSIGRGIGYVTAAVAGAFALWALVTGGGVFALPFGVYAAAVPLAIRSTSPVARGVAAVAASFALIACLFFLSVMALLMTSDF
ncbi:MAG TPA: 1-acyl-sn-glycerol-3-phosphate acyltransferase [Frankiaceae bacterium]|nr:1-acyl-sn-glycerol-3-phosphate acyltransferase [Frankiaceae bacterium]